GARTQEAADVLEPGEIEQHLAAGVAIESERERLAYALVVERLYVVVDGDPPLAGHRRVLDGHLVAELLLDRLDLGVGQITELDVRAPGADRRRPHRRLRADEELVAVEVRPVLHEVVGVAFALEARPRCVALEL